MPVTTKLELPQRFNTEHPRFVGLGSVLTRQSPMLSVPYQFGNNFIIHAGGAEFNVLSALSSSLRCRGFLVTQLVDDPDGKLIRERMGAILNDQYCRMIPESEARSLGMRNPSYTADSGSGERAPFTSADRLGEVAGFMKTGEIDWRRLFEEERTDWFHSGGIYAGISRSTHLVLLEAYTQAKELEVFRSYDLNFRASLYADKGGARYARAINISVLPHIDVVFGGIGDYQTVVLGEEAEVDSKGQRKWLTLEDGKRILNQVQQTFPNLQCLGATFRVVKDANLHSLANLVLYKGEFFEVAHKDVRVVDRIGSGDAFVAGFLHDVAKGLTISQAVRTGWACAVLACTTDGDRLKSDPDAIAAVAAGNSQVIVR